MARVADYTIIADAWHVDDATTNTIKFTVPDNIDTGSRCILNFMFKVWCEDDMTLSVSINGTDVWTWSATGGTDQPMRCIQEVVSAKIVRAGENIFQFFASSNDYRSTELSDIVLWFQGSA